MNAVINFFRNFYSQHIHIHRYKIAVIIIITGFFVFCLMTYFLIVQHTENAFLKNENENLNKQLSGFSSVQQKPVSFQPFWKPINRKPPYQMFDLHIFERNIIRYDVYASIANFHWDSFYGGFWGATIVLTNNSDFMMDSIQVVLSIFRYNETFYSSELITFANVNPHSVQELQLPPSPFGKAVKVKVQGIISHALDLHGNFKH
jgi:hypothetical protein